MPIDTASVGIGQNGTYWCADCGTLEGPCQHFPPILVAAPEMLRTLESVSACLKKVSTAIRWAKGEL